jgi:hypothetical protein
MIRLAMVRLFPVQQPVLAFGCLFFSGWGLALPAPAGVDSTAAEGLPTCLSISFVKAARKSSRSDPPIPATLPMVLRIIGFLRPLNLGDNITKKSSRKGYCFSKSLILVLALIPMAKSPPQNF